MGIFDFFSKKENTQGNTASQTQGGQQGTTSNTSQSGLWNQLSGLFGNYSQYGTPGQTNQYQTNAVNSQSGLVGGLGTAMGTANTLASQGLDPNSIARFQNPHEQQVINNMLQDYQTQNAQTLDAGRGRQAAQSALGNRTGADALILQGQQDAQAKALAGARQSGFNTAAGLAGQSAGLQAQGAGLAGQLGNIASGINQNLFGMGQTLYENPLNWMTKWSQGLSPWTNASGTNNTGNYSGTSWGNTTGQTNQTTTKQPSPWEIVSGLGGTIMSMFSDERVKDDIETIGETFDGQPIYRYTKFGVPEIGLMAQDVEKRDPDAVGSLGGIKTLDKFRATEGAARKGRFADGGSVGGLGSTSFADKVRAAHAAVKEMSEGGKVERPGAAFGGWEPTLTMGSMSPSDADAMVGTANSNQWGHDFKKWGDALSGAKIGGGGDDDRGGGGGNSAMDALRQSQAEMGRVVAAADPRNYLPKMALGGVPGMYAGGDPDAEAAYDNEIYVPYGPPLAGTTLDYEPAPRAGLGHFERLPEGSPQWPKETEPVAPPSLGAINPGLSQYFDRRALDVAPPAPTEVAGARYDAPPPPPRYEAAQPRERGFVRGIKDLFSGNFREGLENLTANDAHSATPNWGGKWGPTFMSMSSLTGDAARNILAQQKERNDKLNADRVAEMRLAELRGQLPATMGGGETLAARQLANAEAQARAQREQAAAIATGTVDGKPTIAQQQLDAENWVHATDPLSGAIFLYNKKTGEKKPLSGGTETASGGLNPLALKEWQKEAYTKHLPAAQAAYEKGKQQDDDFTTIAKLQPYLVTGSFGDLEMSARRFLSKFAGMGDPNKIAATETVRSMVQKGVLEQMKDLKPATNLDVQFAEKGTATLANDPNAIAVLAPGFAAIGKRSQFKAKLEMDLIKAGQPPAAHQKWMDEQINAAEKAGVIPPSPWESYAAQLEKGTAPPGPGTAPAPAAGTPAPAASPKAQLMQLPDGAHDLPAGRFIKRGTMLIPATGPLGSATNPFSKQTHVQKAGEYAFEGGKLWRRTNNMFTDRWEEVAQ